jgi:hypothetical protein
LIENNWANSGGDALTPHDINAAFVEGLRPMTGRERNWLFVAGIDLGLTRDGSAVVVLAVPTGGRAGRIRLAHNKLWRPSPGKKIDLLDIERHLIELDEQYGLEFCAFDPWQMEHMAQRLEADSPAHRRRNQRRRFGTEPWMREIPPTAANLREQATLTIECFQDHRLQLYECDPLRRDLQKLRVEEKTNGTTFRLTSPRDGEGHGDSFSAFANALLIAHELAGKKQMVLGDMTSDSGDEFESPLEQAWRETREREQDYQEEMDFLHNAEKAGGPAEAEIDAMMQKFFNN